MIVDHDGDTKQRTFNMADIKHTITKLNNANYPNWKFKVELLLRSKGLWKKVIETARPAPVAANDIVSNQATLTEWDDRDGEAKGIIGLTIEEDQIALIRTCQTAKLMWDALKDYHEKNTLTNRVFLMRSICSLKLAEGGDAKAHINKLTDLFTKLRDIGEEMLSDRWSAAMLLSSLPDSYDALITSLESRREDEITFALVQQRVIAEYERHSMGNSGGDSILKMVATGRRCYFCKEIGTHIKKDCKKYKDWLAKKNKSGSSGGGGKSVDKIASVKESGSKSSNDTDHFMFAVSQHRSLNAQDDFMIDSGATRHAVNDKRFFTKFNESYKSSVKVATGERSIVNGIGSGNLTLVDENGNIRKAIATEVLYAPDLVTNVISVGQLTKNGFGVEFSQSKCEIKYKGKQIAVADIKGDLYVMRRPDMVCVVLEHNEKCIHTLHRKMGHRDPNAIRKMISNGSIVGLEIVECGIREMCDVCLKGKMTRTPFPKKSLSESSATMDLVHTDVCGPMQTATPGGKRYIVTFIDDFSSFTIIRLLAHKSEVGDAIRNFVEFCETKFHRKPKIVRSDRGGEYTGKRLADYFAVNGIQTQLTAAYSPQQNGKAERKNRTLIEMARCMLIDADLPHTFWGEAVATANFVQNRVITRTSDVTPYERWNGVRPGIDVFQIFGAKCFVHVPSEKRRKLDNVATQMVFLGYDEKSKAYRCYNAESKRIIVSRDVRFGNKFANQESITEFQIKSSKSVSQPIERYNDQVQEEQANETLNGTSSEYATAEEETDSDDIIVNKDDIEPEQPVKRVSQRVTKGVPPKRLIDEIHVMQEIVEPRSYTQAIEGDDREHWLIAMQEEIESHEQHGTWQLVDLPTGKTAIGGKWVFKLKMGMDGQVTRYKARYVAQGFSQKYGEDYDEIFAPVVMHTTFRALLSVAAQRKMIVHHFDAKTAFLNGEISETIYMKQPEGFGVDDPSKVCLLKKCIYGLKQAARSWNNALHDVLEAAGFCQSYNDPCLYSKRINGGFLLRHCLRRRFDSGL